MFPAFLTTIFFSISVICGNRSAKLIGGTEANFWRLTCATSFLAIWAYTLGKGLSGDAFPIFLLSGIIGIGFGDVALFQALPRIGPRLSLLLIQCLTAPFAALIEWLWLGTTLTLFQILCGVIILVGIGISLYPDKRLNLTRKELSQGTLFSVAAALGGAWGAVLSRKAYAVARDNSQVIDGASAAFQRIIGGLLIGGIFLLIVKWQSIKQHVTLSEDAIKLPPKEKWKRVWPWILANSLAGQTIGVSCYQWAFQTTPTGIVLPIVAMTPLVAIPFTLYIEGERPSVHSLVGGAIAVTGVVGLALLK
jgi:drug/metabolite transporter (DMT)-like permease